MGNFSALENDDIVTMEKNWKLCECARQHWRNSNSKIFHIEKLLVDIWIRLSVIHGSCFLHYPFELCICQGHSILQNTTYFACED